MTEIGSRIIRELAFGAGAREVMVYRGSMISTKIENYDVDKSSTTTT